MSFDRARADIQKERPAHLYPDVLRRCFDRIAKEFAVEPDRDRAGAIRRLAASMAGLFRQPCRPQGASGAGEDRCAEQHRQCVARQFMPQAGDPFRSGRHRPRALAPTSRTGRISIRRSSSSNPVASGESAFCMWGKVSVPTLRRQTGWASNAPGSTAPAVRWDSRGGRRRGSPRSHRQQPGRARFGNAPNATQRTLDQHWRRIDDEACSGCSRCALLCATTATAVAQLESMRCWIASRRTTRYRLATARPRSRFPISTMPASRSATRPISASRSWTRSARSSIWLKCRRQLGARQSSKPGSAGGQRHRRHRMRLHRQHHRPAGTGRFQRPAISSPPAIAGAKADRASGKWRISTARWWPCPSTPRPSGWSRG